MDKPRIQNQEPEPKTLSPCKSGRRRKSSASNSPEFEFWMVRNPSFPQPKLLSADELFVNGFLLPLHLLPNKNPDPQPDPETSNTEPEPEPEPGPGPELTTTTTEATNVLTASKRWKDIFKKGDKKVAVKNQEDKEKEKEKKREKKSQSGASSAELNINIWPFSRSRSAGNGGTRPRMVSGAPGTRKVSSAPCSRSNSAGESKSRKWPSSPGRPGVHLGRSSPVWQVRRGGSGVKSSEPPLVRSGEKGVSKKEVTDTRRSKIVGGSGGGGGGGAKAKVLNLNVPMCIGYKHHLSCRSDENSAIGVGGSGGSGGSCNGTTNCGGGGGGGSGGHANNVGNGGHLFNLRSLFTKKVY